MRHLTLMITLCMLAPLARASVVEYDVSVDTSQLTGAFGNIYLQFDGINDAQFATVSITDFATTGTLEGLQFSFGDVSGSLPGTLTIDNGAALNQYSELLQFGSSISFDVTFGGPAVTDPNGTSSSGSTFALAFTGLNGVPLFTSDGVVGVINLNLDGSLQPIAYSDITSFTAVAPEPGSLALVIPGVLCLAAAAFCKRMRKSRPPLGRLV